MAEDYQENAVSVVMPVHNAGQYLRESVDSILAQQEVQLELLIIDDHCTDNALQGLPDDQRVRIIKSPQRGIVSALNVGLATARMPWIARMDADDIAHPRRLQQQLDYCLKHPHVDICGARVEMFNEQQTIAGGYLEYQRWINTLCDHNIIERDFFIESPIPHPTALFRHSVIEELGGYHDSSWPEDYDLWCRALIQGKQFGKPADANLLRWRDHADRLSRNDKRYAKQQFLQCKAHYLSKYLAQKNINQVLIWGAGKTGLKMHDYLSAEQVQVKSFIDINPKLKGRRKRNKPVFVSEPIRGGSWLLPETERMILVAVSARGARKKIREILEQSGLSEQNSFLFVA